MFVQRLFGFFVHAVQKAAVQLLLQFGELRLDIVGGESDDHPPHADVLAVFEKDFLHRRVKHRDIFLLFFYPVVVSNNGALKGQRRFDGAFCLHHRHVFRIDAHPHRPAGIEKDKKADQQDQYFFLSRQKNPFFLI